MKQYPNTYRVTISDEMKQNLILLKSKYKILPTSFIRNAIKEKLIRDLKVIKKRHSKEYCPF